MSIIYLIIYLCSNLIYCNVRMSVTGRGVDYTVVIDLTLSPKQTQEAVFKFKKIFQKSKTFF